jgi:hypothetical protein
VGGVNVAQFSDDVSDSVGFGLVGGVDCRFMALCSSADWRKRSKNRFALSNSSTLGFSTGDLRWSDCSTGTKESLDFDKDRDRVRRGRSMPSSTLNASATSRRLNLLREPLRRR